MVLDDLLVIVNGGKAKLDISRYFSPTYKSATEGRWAVVGYDRMNELLDDDKIVLGMYEPVTFRIPGGSYTPDWMYVTARGRVIFVEVKASTRQRNYRDARTKLRVAASMFPWFDFYEALADRRGWKITKLTADVRVLIEMRNCLVEHEEEKCQ